MSDPKKDSPDILAGVSPPVTMLLDDLSGRSPVEPAFTAPPGDGDPVFRPSPAAGSPTPVSMFAPDPTGPASFNTGVPVVGEPDAFPLAIPVSAGTPATASSGHLWKGSTMMTWLVPLLVGLAVWYFTGGIGWALVAAVVAFFAMKWWKGRAAASETTS